MRVEERATYQLLCDLLADRSREEDWAALSPADWDLFLKVARVEGVAPLAYWHFKEANWPAAVPESVRESLADAHRRTAVRNMLRFQELGRILDALAEAEIPVIVLKGAALAATIYPNIALRPMGDLDLLVPRRQVRKAVRLLAPLGYHEPVPEMAPLLGQAVWHHTELRRTAEQNFRLKLDLHWNMIAPGVENRSPSPDWFWEQTQPIAVPAQRAAVAMDQSRKQQQKRADRALTPTAQLLHLSAHIALQHELVKASLLWLYDLYLLAHRESERLDWAEAVARAREFRWSRALHGALMAARERFDLPLPDGVLADLAGEKSQQIACRRQSHEEPAGSPALRAWTKLTGMGWSSRARLLLGITFPIPAYLVWRYNPRPRWLWPLCYPYRWLDILRSGLGGIGELVIRKRKLGTHQEAEQ